MAATVMLVEDERKLRDLVRSYLERAGFTVLSTGSGAEAIMMASSAAPDLIVLDLGLPDVPGETVATELRALAPTPIVMLTAKSAEEDRIRGLELGADDYLVKPFSFTELILRVRTLLRRGVAREADQFHLADLHIDVLRRRVTRMNVPIALTNKEFTLLHLLVRREGEVLSRTLIASQVWDMNFDSDTNVVDVAIKRLRAKIDRPFEPKIIHTARGIGYVCEVRPCDPAP
jgi:two-component system copper resistance phosphate regulon response regulator CusR